MSGIYRLEDILAMAGSKRARARIKQKTAVQKCLCCDEPALSGRRGLCSTHWNLFANTKYELTNEAARKRFDRQQVLAGLVLEPRPGRRPKLDNPFKRKREVS